jgi:predicted RNA-binding Zn-ribbon protein involved in translation (DUF1610 family)
MIVLGSRIWQQTVASGQFHCPKCNVIRSYEQKCIIKHPAWYRFLPFIEQVMDEFVECQACRQTYQLEVLQYNHGLAANRLMLSVKYALESGVPAQVLQDELVGSGMNATGATRLVNSASESQQKTCPNCGLRQAGSLLRCHRCSRLLHPIY